MRKTLSVSIFTLVVLMLSLTLIPMFNFGESVFADTVSVNLVNEKNYTISLNSAGMVSTSMVGSAEGQYGGMKDTISVKTDSPRGYKLFIGMSGNGITSNRLNKDGSASATYYIPPTQGTFNSPQPLMLNSWGYAISPDTEGNTHNNFSGSYDLENEGFSSSDLFAAMPQKGDEQLIQSIPKNKSGDVTGSVDVYYGIKISNALVSGNYKNTVVYTAIAETISGEEENISVSPSVFTSELGGETLSIHVPIKTNMTSDTTVTVGGKNCPITTNTISNGYIQLQCTLPALQWNQMYTVSVSLPKYEIVYDLENAITYDPTIAFGGITKMQDMTPEVCGKVSPSSSVYGVLQDTRDGRYYRVFKAGSGQCRMKSELKLDLDKTKTLTPDDTDIVQSWTPENNTRNEDDGVWPAESSSEHVNTAYSYGTKNNKYTTSSYKNSSELEGRIGNLYNYYAATAGTVTSETGEGQATYSICPKGWRMASYSEMNSYGAFLDRSIAGISSFPKYKISDGKIVNDNPHVWTTTIIDLNRARSFYEYNPGGYATYTSYEDYNKADGAGIICIAK